MSDQSTPSSKAGWKALAVAFILGFIFLGFFYLAVSNEPDYMPSQQHKQNAQQHAFKQAPTMSEEAMQRAQATDSETNATAAEHGMSEEEHQNMNQDAHGHGH